MIVLTNLHNVQKKHSFCKSMYVCMYVCIIIIIQRNYEIKYKYINNYNQQCIQN